MRKAVSLTIGGSAVFALLIAGAWRTGAQQGGPRPGDPLPGLNKAELAAFAAGAAKFAEPDDPSEGLGPVFNGRSCGECHAQAALGGSSPDVTNARVTRFARITNGKFDPMTEFGGPVVQRRSLREIFPNYPIPGEVVPSQATLTSLRATTPLFGAGMIEAIPDAEILSRERPGHPDGDGVAGVANRVFNPETGKTEIGRFGWKAQVSTLHRFSGEAYLNEVGVTSPFFPNENLPQGHPIPPGLDPVADPEDDGTDVNAFANFMRLLAPPSRRKPDPQAQRGEQLFGAIRCGSCHTPMQHTGNSPIQALRNKEVGLYSDLLLHNMGLGLADGMEQESASGSQWRTAPLWGVSLRRFFMHDGKSLTYEQAIQRHGGEATTARDRYNHLSPQDRQAVLAFLNTL